MSLPSESLTDVVLQGDVPVATRGFGSFYNEDVEVLVRRRTEEYQAPPLVVTVPTIPPIVEFGLQIRNSLFLLDPEWCFINHGAFGAANRISFEAAQEFQRYLERQPVRFMDRYLLPGLADVTRQLSTFVGCAPEDLALVPNATTGLNAVFHSLKLAPKDRIFLLDTAYGSVKHMVREACLRTGAACDEATLRFPICRAKDVVEQVANQIQAGTKVAVFDHISSQTAILFPIEELVQLCHSKGILVVVDGAHGLFQVPLNLGNPDGPDIYVANAHKWLACPKGAGFLFARRCHQSWLRPDNISHGWGHGFISAFIWNGTHDYSALLSIPSALDLWRCVGMDAVRKYCRELLRRAGELLVSRWGTGTLVPLDGDLCAWMALVRLPPLPGTAAYYQDVLHQKYRIVVPIKVVQGSMYVRISAHVYNRLEDYSYLAEAIVEIQSSADHANLRMLS